MKILSHRGYWLNSEEKNTRESFERSFSYGFGTETDIRDYLGELVISHDIADHASMLAKHMLDIHQKQNSTLALALNIKSDGLQLPLLQLIEEYQLTNYFLFDMSIPDALASLRYGLKCFTRQSEYEQDPAFYDLASGVWIDGFHDEWWNETIIQRHLDAGKQVCIVSPELHKRPHKTYWELLNTWQCLDNPSLMICTDFPEEARELFIK